MLKPATITTVPARRPGVAGTWEGVYYELSRSMAIKDGPLTEPLDPNVDVASANDDIVRLNNWLVVHRKEAIISQGRRSRKRATRDEEDAEEEDDDDDEDGIPAFLKVRRVEYLF